VPPVAGVSYNEHVSRTWRRRLIAGLLLGVTALNALAYMHARAMTRFTQAGELTDSPADLSFAAKVRVLFLGATIPHPRSQRTPESVGLAYETHRLQGMAGLLEAWVIRAPREKGLAVLFHGYALNKGRMLDVASYFHALGWSTVLVDFRGCGGSQGERTTIGWEEAKDVATTVSWVRATLGESSPVLFGHSMGAVAILRAVAVEGVRPRAVIADAPFGRLLTTIQNRFSLMGLPTWGLPQLLVFFGGVQNGFDGFAHNPVDYATKVSSPTLLLRGANDPTVTEAEMLAILHALGGRKALHTFPEVGHDSSLSVTGSEWAAAVGPFLDKIAPGP
jgi:pimeloyl-ACP methyl ester carboxylesterase